MMKRTPRKKDPWAELVTESPNPHSRDLDLMKPTEIVRLIAAEDARAVARIAESADTIAAVARDFANAIVSGGRVVYIGAGTSGRLGVIDAAELVPTFGLPRKGPGSAMGLIAGGPAALRRSIEGAEDDAARGRAEIDALKLRGNDLVIGISASSMAPYVRGALAAAHARKSSTALVTMNIIPRPRYVDHLIAVPVGPEVLAGSTRMKSGLTTKSILHSISTTAMVIAGKVYGNRMVDLKTWCAKLDARANRLMIDIGGVSRKEALLIRKEARDDIKLALVMARTGLSRKDSRARLKNAGGNLRAALES